MKKTKQNGITLIALVITIIVLLILAGVSIATLTGENGILTRANEAKTETEEAKEDELRKLTALEAATNINETTHKDNSTGEEKTVTIPAGFAVSQVEGEKEIDEGLVIIDKNGNEYVWIPVDGILGENEKTIQNAVDGEIILGRYVFDENGKIDTNLTPKTLNEELKLSSDASYLETSLGKGNAPAKDMSSFLSSVRENGGYYIGRYEAGIIGYDPNNITKSNINEEIKWTGYEAKEGESLKLVCRQGQQVWNYITQNKASELCRNIDKNYMGVKSDLTNSYAWDTAILFIQKNGKNKKYSIQNSSNTNSQINTGTSGDVQCNIYDMASNCSEWTTEDCSFSGRPCVSRGGIFSNSDFYTSIRDYNRSHISSRASSFRPILYL